jgi:hypothetical protein
MMPSSLTLSACSRLSFGLRPARRAQRRAKNRTKMVRQFAISRGRGGAGAAEGPHPRGLRKAAKERSQHVL